MDKHTLNIFKRILKNIEILKANRELIESYSENSLHCGQSIEIPGLVVTDWRNENNKSNKFAFGSGACRNIDLYALDSSLYCKSSQPSRAYVLTLDEKLVQEEDRCEDYPVDNLLKQNNWLNPERWVFLDFVEQWCKGKMK